MAMRIIVAAMTGLEFKEELATGSLFFIAL